MCMRSNLLTKIIRPLQINSLKKLNFEKIVSFRKSGNIIIVRYLIWCEMILLIIITTIFLQTTNMCFRKTCVFRNLGLHKFGPKHCYRIYSHESLQNHLLSLFVKSSELRYVHFNLLTEHKFPSDYFSKLDMSGEMSIFFSFSHIKCALCFLSILL